MKDQLPKFAERMFWYCEGCRGEGPIEFPAELTVRDAINRLREAHAKESPRCTDTTRRLRILDDQSLAKLKARFEPR